MINSLLLAHPGHGRVALRPRTAGGNSTLAMKAKLFYEAGQYRKCCEVTEQAGELVNLRAAGFIRLKDYKGAWKLIGTSQDPNVQYNRALCLYAMNKCEESLAVLSASQLTDPETHKLRACLLRKLGRSDEAEADFALVKPKTASSLNVTLNSSTVLTRVQSASVVRPKSTTIRKRIPTKTIDSLRLHPDLENVEHDLEEKKDEIRQDSEGGMSTKREEEAIRISRKMSLTLMQQTNDRKRGKMKKMSWAKKFVVAALHGKLKQIVSEDGPETPPGLKMRDMDERKKSLVLDTSIFEDLKRTKAFIESQQSQSIVESSNPYRTFRSEGFTRLSFYTTMKVISEFLKPERDLDLLYEYLKSTKFLSRFYPAFGKRILEAGHLEEVLQGQVIFKQGDPGLNLYMIIRGSVEVVKTTRDFGKYPLVVASIYDGEAFGDYSVVKAGVQQTTHLRTADCRAAERSWLMKVEMRQYLDIMSTYSTTHLEDLLRFLCRLPLFAGAEKMELCIMADHMEARDYRMEELILDKGMASTKLYIIMSGRVLATGKVRTRTIARHYGSGFITRVREVESSSPMATGQFFGELSLLDVSPPATTTKFTAWSGNVKLLMMTPDLISMIPEPIRSNFLEHLKKAQHYEQKIPSFQGELEEIEKGRLG